MFSIQNLFIPFWSKCFPKNFVLKYCNFSLPHIELVELWFYTFYIVGRACCTDGRWKKGIQASIIQITDYDQNKMEVINGGRDVRCTGHRVVILFHTANVATFCAVHSCHLSVFLLQFSLCESDT